MSKTLLLIVTIAIAIVGFFTFRVIQDPSTIGLTADGQKKPDVQQVKGLATAFDQWREFAAPSGHFKVLLPALPQHATEKLRDPKTQEPRQYDMYVSEEGNGTLFMISIISIPDNKQQAIDEGVLKTVMNDMLKSTPNGKLKTMKIGNYKEFPSIDFAIENDQVLIDGKVFLVQQTLYALTSVAKRDMFLSSEFDFFINSFQLLNNKE